MSQWEEEFKQMFYSKDKPPKISYRTLIMKLYLNQPVNESDLRDEDRNLLDSGISRGKIHAEGISGVRKLSIGNRFSCRLAAS